MYFNNSIGIFGGTFDPIHYGHLVAAEWARQLLSLEKIIFIPVAIPSHKNLNCVSLAKDRYNMVEIAIEGNSGFEISPIEINRQGISYTIDTIEYYHSNQPELELYLILGVDSFLTLNTWKNYLRLVEICHLVVVTRPGYTTELAFEDNSGRLEKFVKLEIPGVDISSSEIRSRISQDKSIRYLVPSGVEEYILKRGLYRKEG